jgi:glutaredoxin-related protein
MPRAVLAETQIHPAVRDKIAQHHSTIVREVQDAVAVHPVVVVGMAMNPFPKRAKRMLDEAGVPYHYITRGSYFSKWRERNALKMWTGWPTLPMVFVRGKLIGGAEDLQRLIANGELPRLVADKAPTS